MQTCHSEAAKPPPWARSQVTGVVIAKIPSQNGRQFLPLTGTKKKCLITFAYVLGFFHTFIENVISFCDLTHVDKTLHI